MWVVCEKARQQMLTDREMEEEEEEGKYYLSHDAGECDRRLY